LVTSWSVRFQFAEELVSDLFKRQAEDPKLIRAEAMRQAMMALMDEHRRRGRAALIEHRIG